jgi:hypothetical protein
MSQTDNFGVGGLTGGSMESNSFFGGSIYSQDATSGSTALYIDGGLNTGHIHFYNVFFAKNGGDSWVFIRLGASDDQAPHFPIGLHDCVGESGASSPSYGVHIHNSGVAPLLNLCSLTLYNCRWQFPTTNNILCDGASSSAVQLIAANIYTPFNDGANAVSSIFQQCAGCTLNLQFESTITIGNGVGNFITWIQNAPTITVGSASNIIYNGGNGTVVLPEVGFNGNTPQPKNTGWGAPTGGGLIANFPGSSATTGQCGQVLSTLISVLESYGILGA